MNATVLPLPLVPVIPNNHTRKPMRSWERRREQAMAVAQVYREIGKRDPEFDRIGRSMQECGTVLEFAVTNDHKWRLLRANSCDTRLCPMCSWRRSKKLGYELSRAMKTYQKRNPALAVIMLTLTERNVSGGDLGSSIDQISNGFSKLRHRPEWKRSVKASFRSIEVTRSRDGEYHPHMHILMFVSEEVSQSRWAELWGASRGLDYHPAVHKQKAQDFPHWAQYVTKEQNYIEDEEEDGWRADAGVIIDLHNALRRRRLIAWSRELSEIRNELGADREEYVISHYEVYRWRSFTSKRGAYWLAASVAVSHAWSPANQLAA